MVPGPRQWLKRQLTYEPMAETEWLATLVDTVRVHGAPCCPPDVGDLIFSLIRTNAYRRCLETGFYTGSTALYMAAAVAPACGEVLSIGLDSDELVENAQALLQRAGVSDCHTLLRENTNRVLPRLFLAGERFDFAFVDDWKTFDHLAFEIYLFNQILATGGTIVFDDAYLPSVDKAMNVLIHHYGYKEIDYTLHNQTSRLRLFQILTRRSLKRPYRALRKMRDVADQPAFADWRDFDAF